MMITIVWQSPWSSQSYQSMKSLIVLLYAFNLMDAVFSSNHIYPMHHLWPIVTNMDHQNPNYHHHSHCNSLSLWNASLCPWKHLLSFWMLPFCRPASKSDHVAYPLTTTGFIIITTTIWVIPLFPEKNFHTALRVCWTNEILQFCLQQCKPPLQCLHSIMYI